MTVGERIKKRREELGLSQEELAVKMGLKDKSSVSRFESGDPSLATVERAANALHCSLAYLMGWEDAQLPPSTFITNMIAAENVLNEKGIVRVNEYISELMKIPEYRK